MKLWVGIATYQRPRLLQVSVDAAREVLGDYLGGIGVAYGDDEQPIPDQPMVTFTKTTPCRLEEGCGLKRKDAITPFKDVPDDDVYLFFDDDIELQPELTPELPAILDMVSWPQVGGLGLAMNVRRTKVQFRKLVFHNGGFFVNKKLYWEVGGHGEDYVDDVELAARLVQAGKMNVWYGTVKSIHHANTPGGLTATHGKRTPENNRSAKWSRLAERYPDVMVRDGSWLGFRFK